MESELKDIFKLTGKQKEALEKSGLKTARDLFYNFPTRFETSSNLQTYTDADNLVKFEGIIKSINMRRSGGKRRVMLAEAVIETNSGSKEKVTWFNQPYIAKQFEVGQRVKIEGKVTVGKNTYITNPIITKAESQTLETVENSNSLSPVYSETKNISSLWIKTKLMKLIEEGYNEKLPEYVPEETRKKLNLPDLSEALKYIHFPASKNEYDAARKRFSFEIMFLLQLIRKWNRLKRVEQSAYQIEVDKKDIEGFVENNFDFEATKAQKKVIKQILVDISKNTPMARLLQGDVGSGKTAVAAAIIYGVVTAKTKEKTSATPQAVYLAPTELLAKQQFEVIEKLFKHLNIKIGLITSKECYVYPSKVIQGSHTKISKAKLKEWVANGEISITVGTHALIQKDITFKRLSLAIIDEQHRFGVAQRQKILTADKNHIPHLLSMTATPIPRSLAFAIYGDLDISVIDELPKGRKQVVTTLLKEKDIDKVYKHIKTEIDKGHQAYIICPRIEESENSDLRSVEEEFKYIKKNIFPNENIAMLHGKLKQKEKDEIMNGFINKEIKLLVATTVIEVGINVPNANIITILHAERFGLAQLHQLRGRVLRSSLQSYCYAITSSKTEQTLKRLEIFEKTFDGFELSEKDLELRGSGAMVGFRQSGIPDLAMEAFKNTKLVAYSKEAVENILENDPKLKNNTPLMKYIEQNGMFND